MKRLAVILFLTAALAGGETLNLFWIGNSLTDGMVWIRGSKPGAILPYVQSGGDDINYDKCSSAGTTLHLHWWQNENQYRDLTNGGWDIVVLQPYNRMFYHEADQFWDPTQPESIDNMNRGCITNAVRFIQYALQDNPNAQFYIYSHWPKGDPDDFASFDFEAEWLAPYDDWNSYSHDRAQNYFDLLIQELEKQNIPGLQTKLRQIPVGDVLYELHQRMKAGQVPGWTDVKQLYNPPDVNHLLAGPGRFVCAATWYATLFQKSPAGLDYTFFNTNETVTLEDLYYEYGREYYQDVTPEFAAIVHEVAWEVVRRHPYAGIAPFDYDRDILPNDWEEQYFGGITNASPDAAAANSRYTLQQSYIAGISPVDPDAEFLISAIRHLPRATIEWNATSGRVYSVYWTTNLLSGFQCLESNLTGGAFTDTVSGVRNEGFYKIEVGLE
jgi:hypothetical protein